MHVRYTLRRVPTIVRHAVRDLRYGSFLGGTIKTKHAHLGAHDIGNAEYDELERLFAGVEVRPDDVIVDVGCGKGRAINWFLSEYPGNDVVGLELDPDVCAKTAKRLERRPNVTILCGDAIELLPERGTLFYLFNPFEEPVVERFAERLAAMDGDGRRVVYYNSKFLAPFERDPRFEVTPIAGPHNHASALIRVSPAT
jgi:SAM-dependent methyltransferase